MRRVEIIVHPDVEKFISTLQDGTIAKVLRTIDLLEKFGYQLSLPHSKKIRSNLFELRIKGKQEVRIFYHFNKEKVYLIHAFIKKQPKTPLKEIKTALKKIDYI